MRIAVLGAALSAAFVAGFAVSQTVSPVGAQSSPPPLSPQIIKVGAMTDDEIGPLINNTDLRSRTLVATEWGTVAVQSGNVLKHFHADANEIQYILDGAGSFWLGDKQIDVKAGDFLVIPKGTPHAGSKASTGRFKTIAIKMPPQRPDDVKPVD